MTRSAKKKNDLLIDDLPRRCLPRSLSNDASCLKSSFYILLLLSPLDHCTFNHREWKTKISLPKFNSLSKSWSRQSWTVVVITCNLPSSTIRKEIISIQTKNFTEVRFCIWLESRPKKILFCASALLHLAWN